MRIRLSSAVVVAIVVALVAVAPAGAVVPLTKDRPYENLCKRQGGTFGVAIDLGSLYCDKEGALFTAFTPDQLAKQREMCARRFGGSFGVQGFIRSDRRHGHGNVLLRRVTWVATAPVPSLTKGTGALTQ